MHSRKKEGLPSIKSIFASKIARTHTAIMSTFRTTVNSGYLFCDGVANVWYTEWYAKNMGCNFQVCLVVVLTFGGIRPALQPMIRVPNLACYFVRCYSRNYFAFSPFFVQD